MQNEQKEEWLTSEEVEKRYKIPKQTQNIFREKHNMPFTKVGKRYQYNKLQLDMWLRRYSVNEVAVEAILEEEK